MFVSPYAPTILLLRACVHARSFDKKNVRACATRKATWSEVSRVLIHEDHGCPTIYG
jgi:hypothetical protein